MKLVAPAPDLQWLATGGESGILRPWCIADAPALVQAWGDADIARWNPVPPDPSLERATAWIASWHDRLAANTALDLCICDDEGPDSPVVGEVGLAAVDTARRAAQIGYWLLPEGRGRGLARAATQSLADWALTEGSFELLVARCDPDNLASQAVATRAGFRHARDDPTGYRLYTRRTRDL